MKHVVSVSLGSPEGDFTREIQLGNRRVRLCREGMDGSMERARTRIVELDGQVDAIGLGGIDIYLYIGGEQFVIGDGLRLAELATRTPVVDGSGLKETLERLVAPDLVQKGLVHPEQRVLMVSAMDRFGMAESFVQLGCPCVFGDLIFNMGIDYPLTTLAELEEMARKYRSRLLTVPFHLLYPTGAKQKERKPDERFAKYYDDANIIGGDRHLICRHLPDRVDGKGIVTTTTRPDTLEMFRKAGVRWVATTTPEMEGVSGGTNIIEAALVAVTEKPAGSLTPDDYREWIDRLHLRGALHHFA